MNCLRHINIYKHIILLCISDFRFCPLLGQISFSYQSCWWNSPSEPF